MHYGGMVAYNIPHRLGRFMFILKKRSFVNIFSIFSIAIFLTYYYSIFKINYLNNDYQIGLDFLFEKSGFFIHQSPYINFPHFSNLSVLLIGVVNTLLVSMCGVISSVLVATLITSFFISDIKINKFIVNFYVNSFRNIPLLVQILFWYEILLHIMPTVHYSHNFLGILINNRGIYIPYPLLSIWTFFLLILLVVCLFSFKIKNFLFNIFSIFIFTFLILNSKWSIPFISKFNVKNGFRIYPEFLALYLSLTLYIGAFLSVNFISGYQSIPKATIEAAKALGLSKAQQYYHVFLPVSLPKIIPPSLNQALNLIKDSSLGVAIGFPEIISLFAGTVLNQTGHSIEIILIVMLIYLIINLIFSFIINQYNKKVRVWNEN